MSSLMKYGVWEIEQTGFDQSYLGKTEAIMCLGNGYMGGRAAEEESYIGEVRDTFVSGTFNQFDENEVTELPNVPDMWAMNFVINGKRFFLTDKNVSGYRKWLDVKNGELIREFIWEHKKNKIKFEFHRFVSKARRHLQVSEVKLTNLTDQTIDIDLKSGINGQVSNEGSQHFTDGEKLLVDGRYIQMMPETTNSKIQFVQTVEHKLSPQNIKIRPETGRRSFFMNYSFTILPNDSETIEKRASIYTSIDNDLVDRSVEAIRKIAINEFRELDGLSFVHLLNESSKEWKKVWDKHPIKIESENPQDQLAIYFSKYHLHSMVPSHDERMNIGAKGLSGEGYKGHTFWDTEIFMLPYFTYTHPEIAKKLLTYRYLGLEGAHKKAKLNGYEGAQYPWESAWPTDGEVTPVWGAADIITGKAIKILSGFIEQHITSDVAFGIKQYLDVTGDEDFADSKAYELLIDTAKFWASRLEMNKETELYEIKNVMGPDEYKEEIDNNSYTNYTAHWNIKYVIGLIKELKEHKTSVYEKLDKKFQLSDLLNKLVLKADKIFLPRPTSEGIIPQDDSYLNKPLLDLSKYKSTDSVDGLFHDYNLEQINGFQVTKQADVLLLLLLFEGLFDKDLKLKNFEYYEPKTTHDSSLSLSTHAILSADLGKLEQSYSFFNRAINIDMGKFMDSSNAGIHAASLGGIWQMVVFGYGGVRMIDGKLRIEPNLPKEWNSLDYGFDYQNQSISVKIDKKYITISKTEGQPITFINKGQEIVLENTLIIPN